MAIVCFPKLFKNPLTYGSGYGSMVPVIRWLTVQRIETKIYESREVTRMVQTTQESFNASMLTAHNDLVRNVEEMKEILVQFMAMPKADPVAAPAPTPAPKAKATPKAKKGKKATTPKAKTVATPKAQPAKAEKPKVEPIPAPEGKLTKAKVEALRIAAGKDGKAAPNSTKYVCLTCRGWGVNDSFADKHAKKDHTVVTIR